MHVPFKRKLEYPAKVEAFNDRPADCHDSIVDWAVKTIGTAFFVPL